MITYSIIKKSQLEGALRMDAEYYQPEFLKLRNIIEKNSLSFEDIIVEFGRGKNLNQTANNNYIKFIRTQNVRPIIIDENGLSFTDVKNHPKLDYGDLLFVRVGEGVGNSSVVTKNFQNSTFSDNVIRIKIKGINPFYVSVLLNSEVGYLLMEQIEKGSARPLISRENLNALKVPKISNNEQIYFEKIINQSENFIENSKLFYSQAENLLLEELGLKDFKNEENLFSIVNLSEVKKAYRIDAEYFQLKYEKLISKIKNYKNGFDSFDNLIEISNMKIEVNPEKEYKYIELADVNENLGIVDDIQIIKGKDLPSRAKMKLQKNDVIVSSVEGSTNKVALINKDIKDLVGSTGFFILREKYFQPEVNLILIKSIIIKALLKREAQGTILTAIPSSSLKRIILPKLNSDIQQKIADLVRKSHQARKKAKELLEEAKQKVEKLIEQ